MVKSYFQYNGPSYHYSDTLLISLKVECRKVGKHALESPPNRVDHESVAVVL